MLRTKRTALARYAARGKQYLVQLRPVPGGGIVLQQLLYSDEVRSFADVDLATMDVKEQELKLATAIDALRFTHSKSDGGSAVSDVTAVAVMASGAPSGPYAPITLTPLVSARMPCLKRGLPEPLWVLAGPVVDIGASIVWAGPRPPAGRPVSARATRGRRKTAVRRCS